MIGRMTRLAAVGLQRSCPRPLILGKPILGRPILGRLILAGIVGLAVACEGLPSRFQPRGGDRIQVGIVDEHRLDREGTVVTWSDFLTAMRRQVAAGKRGEAAFPVVVLHPLATSPPGLLDRLIELLQATGVRSIEVVQ
jgi:hypothetical protein